MIDRRQFLQGPDIILQVFFSYKYVNTSFYGCVKYLINKTRYKYKASLVAISYLWFYEWVCRSKIDTVEQKIVKIQCHTDDPTRNKTPLE